MPDPTPPRRPTFGPDKPPAKPAPPRPRPAFEVVEDEDDVIDLGAPPPKPAKPAPPPPKPAPKPPKPAFEVVEDDFEVVEDEPAPPPARRTATAAKGTGPAGPDPKKKKKKKRDAYYDPEAEAQAHRDKALAHYEWIAPTIILVVGVVLCFVGGIKAGGAVGVARTLIVLVVGLVVSVPISVAALMTIGMLAGIDYGRLTSGILKIAAITCVANGIMFLGDGFGLPAFMYLPLSGLTTLILFMTQFELDYGEANTSVGAINLLSFGVKTLLFLFLLAQTPKGGDKGDDYSPDPADDDPPAEVDRGRDRGPRPGKRDRPKQTRPVDPADDRDLGGDD